jgi:hypothetical protein
MENTFDLVENKIKIDNRFRLKVTDYINKIYKTRNKSILPYDINTEDVFEMLQDLTWTNDDKFVVFFNFEFVMCLMQLGITPNKITYIAPSSESHYEVRDAGWGELGMKSILFDLSIYNKYKSRNQWKTHLMKKIGKLNEFIAVGNIPFTINSTDSSNSKKIGNDFIKLMNQFKQACYILPAKFDSKTFKEDLILNPKLKKIVYHQTALFDIAADFKTCHVVLSGNQTNFIYQINNSSNTLTLNKCNNIILSSNLDTSGYIDFTKKTIGDLWNRGQKNKTNNDTTKQLSGYGKYEVVSNVGKNGNDDFEIILDDEENTLYGKWKVIIANVSGGTAVKIAPPKYSISYSVVGFEVPSEEAAIKLKNFLQTNDVIKLWKSFKRTNANTKSTFLNITLPDGII